MRSKLAGKRHEREIRFRRRQRTENRTSQGINKEILKLHGQFKHLPIRAEFPVAPELMCFLRNPDGMAKFISQLHSCLQHSRPVIVHMENVHELELNAITVLLAVMVEFRSRGIKFTGTNPTKSDARQKLKQSGFFDHLNGSFRAGKKHDLYGQSIHTHGNFVVDSEFSQQLIDRATTTIWGEERRCPGMQRVFIELMHNTVNHAAGGGVAHKHYWISMQELKEEHKAIFCFVNFGIGIFESLARRNLSVESLIETLTKLFGFVDNCRILELILTGEIHRTATGQYFRGKGLPSVYEAFKKGTVSNLSIITNDVCFTSANNEYKKLDTMFAGTFYSWELSQKKPSLAKHI